MSITHLLKQTSPSALSLKLMRARHVLSGLDEAGEKCGFSMFDPEIISFSHGEGMRRPDPEVVAAGIEALLDTEDGSLDNYQFLQDFEPLKDYAIEQFIKDGIPSDIARNFCEGLGCSHVICGFLNATAEKGDIFLVPQTFYHSITSMCDLDGVRLELVTTSPEDGYRLTQASLQRWKSENKDLLDRLKGVFVINPTMIGTLYTDEEMAAIADFIYENDLVALYDATFDDTQFSNQPLVQLSAYEHIKDRVLTVYSAAKSMSLANMRYAWACGGQELVARVNKYLGVTSSPIPFVVRYMAYKAMLGIDEYKKENILECQKRVQLIISCVAEINVNLSGLLGLNHTYDFISFPCLPQAGHSLLINMNIFSGTATGKTGRLVDNIDMVRHLLNDAKISLSPGMSFGFDDMTFRISYACIGAQETYPYHKISERLLALNKIMPQHADNYNKNDVAFKKGFEKGRAMIREGLMERLLPSLQTLVTADRQHILQKIGHESAYNTSVAAR